MSSRAVQITLGQSFFGADGAPLAGGKLKFYKAGTTTPQPVFTSYNKQGPTVTSVTLDASGRLETFVYYDGALNIRLYDSSDTLIEEFPQVSFFIDEFPTGSFVSATDFGDGSKTSATLNAAISALGSQKVKLFCSPGVWEITTDVIFPSTICVWAVNGTRFKIYDADVTLVDFDLPKLPFCDFQSNTQGHLYITPETNCTVYPEIWGATGDGVTDDSRAFNKMFVALGNLEAVYFNISFGPHTYALEKTVYLQNSNFQAKGVPFSTTFKSIATPSGATDHTAAVFAQIISASYGSKFEDIIVDVNDGASKYGFYMASATEFHAIKNIEWNNVYVVNLGSGGIGWVCGDQTATGFDTDAWNYSFYRCHARGGNGATGWQIDANNAYNIQWIGCSHGRKAVGNEMRVGIKTLHGSGFHIFNYFGDLVEEHTNSWCIDHKAGMLTIDGISTETRKVAKLRSNGELNATCVIKGLSINDSGTYTDKIAIDSEVPTTLINCIFRSGVGGAYKWGLILNGGSNTIQNCLLPSFGDELLTVAEPTSLTVDGIRVGTLESLALNPIFNIWPIDTAIGYAPLAWAESGQAGTTIEIQKSDLHSIQGAYTCRVNVSANSYVGTQAVGLKMQADINVSMFKNKKVYLGIVGYTAGTNIPEVVGVLYDVVSSSTIKYKQSNGVFFCLSEVTIPDDPTKQNMEIFTGYKNGQTGEYFLSGVFVTPIDFSENGQRSVLPFHIQNIFRQYGNTEYLSAGLVPVGRGPTRTQQINNGAPGSGTWVVGDIVWNLNPSPTDWVGYICVTAGTPGTWKGFGAIGS